MSSYFCLSVRFLQHFAHGRRDGAEPEWPPSPLRAFQALLAAAAGRWNERTELVHAAPALRWLESQAEPQVVAAEGLCSEVKCLTYVPDNTADLLVPAWKRGDVTATVKRAEKVVRPTHLAGDAVHFLYALPHDRAECDGHFPTLKAAARSITHLGWGIDMAVGDASIITADEAASLPGYCWRPAPAGGTPLRVPVEGTLDDLMRKHRDFLNRLPKDGFRPVPPLRAFRVQAYRRGDMPLQRPYRIFELRNLDGTRFRYPQSKFVCIAGMVRHLAIKAMMKAPPRDVPDDWVETYIAGHAKDGAKEHRQLSYLPLPSIGHLHTNPSVRRVILAASPGEEERLDYVARLLAGQPLRPEQEDEFAARGVNDPPLLVPMKGDGVSRRYTESANIWHSFTPVILPGHDDHNPEKTRRLIERTLSQSGIEQPCSFEWSAFSRFSKALSAHKYDKDKKPTGYKRPKHLQTQTAVHLTLRFNDCVNVPGPLVIGAGRHCGFGVMANAGSDVDA
ncbi:MAG: type I-U CRISPR-associated protein Csb2 [Planctomycetia bacterium]|nr:type I-U CRISPR-associated protein Csb2 [Planctomycetia bacterium]